ncbi:uncharacterized protein LOC133744575 [Rosa rugosa]|uniref:uncharacterized protein LOC133744575 n=1 Tax=Rosa rugosa TaxID=74645 RepID=UPI002B4094AC|nr:uncharacterized protein LOC133744575 [Rosa rugosa]
MEKICGSLGYVNCKVVERTGKQGGGLVFCWKDNWTVQVIDATTGFIDVLVFIEGKQVRLTGFYGNPATGERHHSWEVLRRLSHLYPHVAWFVFGDFNEIINTEEKCGGRLRPSSQIDRFNRVIDDCLLQGVDFSGPLFTWSNGSVHERLDRGLMNNKAADDFPKVHECHLEVGASDHLPLIFDFVGRGLPKKNMGRRRFLFEGFWIKEQRCGEIVKEVWEDEANAHTNLVTKLNKCAEELSRWNRNVIGHVPKKIAALKVSLQKYPIDVQNAEDRTQRALIKYELEKFAEFEEVMWKQKSRIDWLQEGDKNTKFFHAYAKGRGKQNKVTGIFDEHGMWCEDLQEVQDAFVSYFSNLYTTEGCANLDLILDKIPRRVSDEVNVKLLKKFERWEIEFSLKHMAAQKSPGFDGMSALFFKTYWPIVGDSVCAFCLGVLNDGRAIEDFNHTLISLIPKCLSPKNVTEFRPISLCSIIYKLISKTVANRLKKHLPDIISCTQSAFVPGRNIQDNVIAAFETVHTIRVQKTTASPKMVLKLDISKAYDRVEWGFLENVMRKLGFGERWVKLIMKCVNSTSFSVLWRGQPVGQFRPTRGIRQGDPLSPYLFLFVSEGLSGLLQHADYSGLIHGVRAAPTAPSISHLLFADDSLLFVNATVEECVSLKQCLLLYECAAGQRINFQKSALSFGPNVPERLKDDVKVILDVPVVEFHEKYLGLPTTLGRNKIDAFKKLNERLAIHIQGWQGKFLSKAGKLVLIKAVAQAIPTYSMSVFQLPVGVCKKFQSKVSKFWWGKGGETRGIHWCSWDKLCKRKDEGGLGFRDLQAFNQAMLAKTVWRIFWGKRSLVSSLLQAKYFPDTCFLNARLGRTPSAIWRGILWGRQVIELGTRWRIGDGRRVSIMSDKWLPCPVNFKVVTPLQIPAQQKVESLFTDSGAWNVPMVKSLFLTHEADMILGMPLGLRSIPDKLVWHYTKNGVYSVNSGYWVARDLQIRQSGSGAGSSYNGSKGIWEKIWRINAPQKIRVFMWRAIHGFLPCATNLQQRRILDDPSCWFCRGPLETALHALWDCPKAKKTWKKTFLNGVCKVWQLPTFLDLVHHVYTIANETEFESFCFTAWWIWRNRNLGRHGEKIREPAEVAQLASEWQNEYASLSWTKSGGEVGIDQNKVVWNPPQQGHIKMNFDGACDLKNGICGLGVVFRDHLGGLKGALAVPQVGNLSPRSVEALALLHGLRFAAHVGFSNIEIEGDALSVINTLHDSSEDLSSEGHIIDEVKSLAQSLFICSSHFVKRVGNQVAHRLAKEALKVSYPLLCLESGPLWLHESVSKDFQCGV